MNLRACIILSLAGTTLLRAQDDALPAHGPGDSLDFEPKLMLDGPFAQHAATSPTPSPADRVQQCEAALLRAEQRATDSEQLFKEGILAKVEFEGRILAIVRARKDLAQARLAVAALDADNARKSFDARKAPQADLDAANAALKTAGAAAAAASAEWDKAQLAAAALDLQRKRKLFSEGVCSRQEVQMAEDRLALLSGSGTRPPP